MLSHIPVDLFHTTVVVGYDGRTSGFSLDRSIGAVVTIRRINVCEVKFLSDEAHAHGNMYGAGVTTY